MIRHRRRPALRKPQPVPFWYSWRHIAAYVYMTICLFDFVAMPIFYEVINPRESDSRLVAIVQQLTPTTQVQALQILHEERTWKSLTLGQGGLFHMAFGAILGVAAFTRGQEKTEYARNGVPYGGFPSGTGSDNSNSNDDNSDDSGDDNGSDDQSASDPVSPPPPQPSPKRKATSDNSERNSPDDYAPAPPKRLAGKK
jgi:hypothetical protein